MSYSIETAARPHLSMLGSDDPRCVKMLEAFHARLGRPEAFLTFGPYANPDFTIRIDKGATIKETLWVADEDLKHPDGMADNTPEQDASARHHVPRLLAQFL
jgi:hypothetical protein